MNNQIITELRTSPLAMVKSGSQEMNAIIDRAMRADAKEPSFAGLSNQNDISRILNMFNSSNYACDRIAIITITGMMTKYARINWDMESLEWIVPGMDDVAALLQMVLESAECDGAVLVFNTPGGTIQSLYQIEEVLKKRTKPVVALVDGMCASAGMYVASLCDRIIISHKMCSVGSIGVMVQIVDDSQMLKKAGIKVLEIYPPESSEKNKAYRDAIDGKTQTIIEQELTPLAKMFQDHVRKYRKIDENVEGVLAGKMFYAEDAIAAGLADSIGSFEDAIGAIGAIAADHKETAAALTE